MTWQRFESRTEEDGGFVSSFDGFIAINPGVLGEVNVTGNQSQLNFDGNLSIGNPSLGFMGTGELNITTNANVDVAGTATINALSTLKIETSGTFSTMLGLSNEGNIIIQVAVANIHGDVSLIESGRVEVGAFDTVNFHDDLQHNGAEININQFGGVVNVFGDWSGEGPFTGNGIVNFEGELQPGNNGPASVDFGGRVSLGSKSLTRVQIDGSVAGQSDRLNVASDVTLSGDLTIQIINPGDFEANQEYILIDVGGNSNGAFNGLPESTIIGFVNGFDVSITYVGGDGNDVAILTSGPAILLGDVNQDGSVDLLDVSPFVALVSNGQFQQEADVNQDGIVNLLDVDPFIALLAGA